MVQITSDHLIKDLAWNLFICICRQLDNHTLEFCARGECPTRLVRH